MNKQLNIPDPEIIETTPTKNETSGLMIPEHAIAKKFKGKRTRSRSGCFSCRLRRKKCDEKRPECMSCLKIGTECIWPQEGNGSLTKNMRENLQHMPKKKVTKMKAIKTNVSKTKKKSKRKLHKINGKVTGLEPNSMNNDNDTTVKHSQFQNLIGNDILNQDKSDLAKYLESADFVNYTLSETKKMVLINNFNGDFNVNVTNDLLQDTSVKVKNEQNTGFNETLTTNNKDFANYLFNPININDSSLFLDKMLELDIKSGVMMTNFLNNRMELTPLDMGTTAGLVSNKNDDINMSKSTEPLLKSVQPSFTSSVSKLQSLEPEQVVQTVENASLQEGRPPHNVNPPPLLPLTKISDSNISVVSEQSDKKQTVSDCEDDMFGLDEEQTETIYGQLLAKFETWKPSEGIIMSQKNKETTSSKQDLLLYYTFFNYFLPKIGPQPTLPELTTMETFSNVEQNSIVHAVFKCCGATFLAWCQPAKYLKIAEELYEESIEHLRNLSNQQENKTKNNNKKKNVTKPSKFPTKNSTKTISSSPSVQGNEDWLIACFQLLVLRDKLYNGSGVLDRCIENLSHSFSIIEKRYLLNDFSSHQPTSPIDRMLLESFLYNYTVSISVAKSIKTKLPNPFQPVITKLVSMLKLPLFDDCEVEWLNNPVLGSSVDVFIMLAKVSYLGRLKLPLKKKSIWSIRASELLQQCLYYSPPTLPEKVKADKWKYSKYRPGLLCGSIVSKACYLLLYKIINYDVKQDQEILNDPEIKSVVKYAIQALVDIEKNDKLLCILQWALLIIGSFTVSTKDKLVIREYTKSVGETIHAHSGSKIADVLEDIWVTHDLNTLFDRARLSQLLI